jgi:hypothetical protein
MKILDNTEYKKGTNNSSIQVPRINFSVKESDSSDEDKDVVFYCNLLTP